MKVNTSYSILFGALIGAILSAFFAWYVGATFLVPIVAGILIGGYVGLFVAPLKKRNGRFESM